MGAGARGQGIPRGGSGARARRNREFLPQPRGALCPGERPAAGQAGAAGRDAGRFLINTTLGFAGFADVATDLGIERNDEDFGQTLAVWRVPPGPHLVLPLFGPSNIRDGFGVATGLAYGSPIRPEDGDARLGLRAVDVIDTRARFLGTEKMIALQPDPYLFLRESYRQRREVQIRDGVVPDDGDTEDMFLDELLQDD